MRRFRSTTYHSLCRWMGLQRGHRCKDVSEGLGGSYLRLLGRLCLTHTGPAHWPNSLTSLGRRMPWDLLVCLSVADPGPWEGFSQAPDPVGGPASARNGPTCPAVAGYPAPLVLARAHAVGLSWMGTRLPGATSLWGFRRQALTQPATAAPGVGRAPEGGSAFLLMPRP